MPYRLAASQQIFTVQVDVPAELIQLRKTQHKRSLAVARQLAGIFFIFSPVTSMDLSGILMTKYVIQGASLDVLQRAYDCLALTEETIRISKENLPTLTQNKGKLLTEIRSATGATIKKEPLEDSVWPVRVVGLVENVRNHN
jgi:hypothetical protein